MKKLLLSLFVVSAISSLAAGDFNVYGKFGVDLNSKFSKIKDEDGTSLPLPTKAKSGYSFFLEGTTVVAPNTEFGVGIGYITRKGKNFSYYDDFFTPARRISGRMPSYNSIPLYLTAKYNFNTGIFNPYIKFDLGYSFNKLNNENEYDGKSKVSYDIDLSKATNGLYTGLSVGVEYNNFLTELSYVYTKAKLKWQDGDSSKWDNKTIRLSVGYKFNF
ncbi:MAG: outer membrane beta-barrel protein [Fusobacterium sp.]|uniref:outer membrane beta-barrel protein n=1 Tax=Fusobacterium sp. TaxID=68766 RepID=UPI0026DBD75D|nr:outer membrane beta-barrel protein [Fusobacterium sp.]MDO4690068.1 outer membrane beta-barrel protein [Fusobacterium sp.]